MAEMSGEKEGWRRDGKKYKINNKMGLLQHPLYIVLVFPWLVFGIV